MEFKTTDEIATWMVEQTTSKKSHNQRIHFSVPYGESRAHLSYLTKPVLLYYNVTPLVSTLIIRTKRKVMYLVMTLDSLGQDSWKTVNTKRYKDYNDWDRINSYLNSKPLTYKSSNCDGIVLLENL